MTQVPPKAAIVPQLWGNERLKSVALGPTNVIALVTMGIVVLFVIVKFGAVLVAPLATNP